MGGELLEQPDLSPLGVVVGVAMTILIVVSIWVEADGWWYNRKNKDDHD